MAESGIWKKDSVREIAESLGITYLGDDVANNLAADVEYRLWKMIEDATKYMQHSRRTKLKAADVNAALRSNSEEPLWGYTSQSKVNLKKTSTGTGNVYFMQDDEVDLGSIIKMPLPVVPRGMSYTSHWLAIEGVQPLIRENPTQIELDSLRKKSAGYAKFAGHKARAAVAAAAAAAEAAALVASEVSYGGNQPDADAGGDENMRKLIAAAKSAQASSTAAGAALGVPSATTIQGLNQIIGAQPTSSAPVKHVLSTELQLYFTRLTESLLNISEKGRPIQAAALASLSSDPGLHQLVPYIVAWAGQQIARHLKSLPLLSASLEVYKALLENDTLFIEPYLHQIVPPIMTCIVTARLGSHTQSEGDFLTESSIRIRAGDLLASLVRTHGLAYPTFRTRVTRTLLQGLTDDDKSVGCRYGSSYTLLQLVGSGGSRGILRQVKAREPAIKDLLHGESDQELAESVSSQIDALIDAAEAGMRDHDAKRLRYDSDEENSGEEEDDGAEVDGDGDEDGDGDDDGDDDGDGEDEEDDEEDDEDAGNAADNATNDDDDDDRPQGSNADEDEDDEEQDDDDEENDDDDSS